MDRTVNLVAIPPLPVGFTPPDAPRQITREFVRRPAKDWTSSTPVPVVRFDHHCAAWEQQ